MFVCFQCDAENGTYETKPRNMMERERAKALYADISNSTNNLSRGMEELSARPYDAMTRSVFIKHQSTTTTTTVLSMQLHQPYTT